MKTQKGELKMADQEECLHCELVNTITKYVKKRGAICDGEIVTACLQIIAEVMEVHDQKAQADIRKFVDACIAEYIASGSADKPRMLHS